MSSNILGFMIGACLFIFCKFIIVLGGEKFAVVAAAAPGNLEGYSFPIGYGDPYVI